MCRTPLLVALVLLLACPRPAGASELRTLREGGWLSRAAADYLAAFSAGDEEGLRVYVEGFRDATSLARTPVDARVARQLQFAAMLGAVEVVAVTEASPARVAVVVFSPTTGSHFELFFEESDEEPGKIGSQGMRPSEAPDEAVTLEGETLQEMVDGLIGAGVAPGIAVAVGDLDGTLEVACAGLRRSDADDPIECDDAFHVGSITKSMTASIAARLSARDVVDLDATVTSLLDDVELHAGYADVTLADLLSHRAGLEPLTEGDPLREHAWRAEGDDPRAQRMALARDVLARAPTTTPGEGMVYSNAGYVVAAVALESATDTAWEELVLEHVFTPLDLATAHTGWPWTRTASTTHGHFADGTVHVGIAYDLSGPLAPAGDVSMAVADLVRFGLEHLRALDGASAWLDTTTAARLHRPAGGGETGYGLGWVIERRGEVVVHEHAGSAGSYFAVLAIRPDTGRAVAVAFNAGDLSLHAVASRVVDRALR